MHIAIQYITPRSFCGTSLISTREDRSICAESYSRSKRNSPRCVSRTNPLEWIWKQHISKEERYES